MGVNQAGVADVDAVATGERLLHVGTVADVDAAAGERRLRVATGARHEGLRTTEPRNRPEVRAAEADGCSQDGAETLGTGRSTELDTGRCTAELDTGRGTTARDFIFLTKSFLTRVALVLDAGRLAIGHCLLRNVERSAGTAPVSGRSLGWSGRPGVAHSTIFRPRSRGYAPDSLSLFLMPVTRLFPSDPILLMTRGKWRPLGHRHRAATPRIHLPMARNR